MKLDKEQAAQLLKGKRMNIFLWFVQCLIAAIFLFTAYGKLFAYDQLIARVEKRSKGRPANISRRLAVFIAVAEVLGALGILTPPQISPGYLLVRLAAVGLALIMILAGIYHLRRKDSAVPDITLFLLLVFVIVGRWPHP